MSAPEKIVGHLREAGYHPRSNAHGKILCEFVLEDLLAICPKIAEDAAAGRLVYDIQRKIIVAGSEWNIDLVLGPPPSGAVKEVSAKGLEANGAIVVSHDNIDLEASTLVTAAPAPQVGDPLHYDSFLRRICDSYTQRWSGGRSASSG